MTMQELINQGYAEYSDLKPFIKNIIDKGINSLGFRDRTVICQDGSNWDYIPEDQLYEYNPNSHLSVN